MNGCDINLDSVRPRKNHELVLRVRSRAPMEPLEVDMQSESDSETHWSHSSEMDARNCARQKIVSQVFKIVLVGEPGVGKTSLAYRFAYNTFYTSQEIHIGLGFWDCVVQVRNSFVKVIVSDTPGNVQRSVIPNYFRFADAIVLVYDSTNKKSFLRLPYWLNLARKHSDPNCIFFIIATKADCENIDVSVSKAFDYAAKANIDLFHTSALSGSSVSATFLSIVKILQNRPTVRRNVKLEDENTSRTRCCWK